jgi:hypothetical protein
MDWRDRTANGFVVKLRVTQPEEANKRFADFFIGGLLLLMALGGFACEIYLMAGTLDKSATIPSASVG